LELTEINNIFEKFSAMQAIIIGDAMVDTYMWGIVERVSPEAPVPIVSVLNRESRIGGAGNVSMNVKSLGATPFLFSVVGDDEKGRKFRKMMTKEGLSVDGIFTDSTRITTVKNRIISKGQHIARVDEESTEEISKSLENEILKSIEQTINNKKIDVIIFVDYDKGMITTSMFDRVKEMADARKIPVAVDPKKRNFSYYKNLALFKPNFKEFVDGVGFPIEKGDFATIKREAEKIKEKQNLKLIFVTLSELGVFISNGDAEQYYPAVIRYIADVSGAGDTVISVASLAMAAGLSPKTIAHIANLAGGLVCEKTGVVPVNKEQLMNEMNLQKF